MTSLAQKVRETMHEARKRAREQNQNQNKQKRTRETFSVIKYYNSQMNNKIRLDERCIWCRIQEIMITT
jgi:hypothetical protein